MGEVGKQQALQINKGKLTLAQALAEAYGVDFNTSRPEEIYVIRTGEHEAGNFPVECGIA